VDEADRKVGPLNPKPWGHHMEPFGLRELGNAQIGTGSVRAFRIRHELSTTSPLQCFTIANTRRSTPGQETAPLVMRSPGRGNLVRACHGSCAADLHAVHPHTCCAACVRLP